MLILPSIAGSVLRCARSHPPHSFDTFCQRANISCRWEIRRTGSKLHMAVDTLGHLLALHVTPANRDDRAEVGPLAKAVQRATDGSVKLAWADQGYTGSKAAKAAEEQDITLEIVRLPQAKRGFVLLPRRWIVERSFAWATRCRRLVKDYERCASTLAAMHTIAFAGFMLKKAASLLTQNA
nr:transposase [Acetobacter aceti]